MEKNGNMQNTWIEEFYNETNADNRLRILNDNKDNSELDSFREKLWIARYGKRKPKKDKFVEFINTKENVFVQLNQSMHILYFVNSDK